ncbi:uncharacterized protein LOC120078031 [Benincasa hispida]|uniref:uncharacterized protein LOC120078031 n=1 Tax=Benincasa hispida TaxID=102211 RepID=UPI0018FFAD57|nr:uncharacterized protein LOC120078031 [Benincasa hispida]
MALEGRHKFGYLTNEIPRPRPGDPQKRVWKGEDSLLHSMLIDKMEPQIGKPLIYVATARDIWDAVQKLYSKRKNASRLYTLQKQVHECKQGTMDITFYFNKFSSIWQEMDLCRKIAWDCPYGRVQHTKMEEIDRVYDFLAGLKTKFDAVHSQILGHRPVPSLMEVC